CADRTGSIDIRHASIAELHGVAGAHYGIRTDRGCIREVGGSDIGLISNDRVIIARGVRLARVITDEVVTAAGRSLPAGLESHIRVTIAGLIVVSGTGSGKRII